MAATRAEQEETSFSTGDVVWVLTGNVHEEPATVLETNVSWTPDSDESEDSSRTADETTNKEARNDGVLVKFHVSKIREVCDPEKLRALVDDDEKKKNEALGGQRKRRSSRGASSSSSRNGKDSASASAKNPKKVKPTLSKKDRSAIVDDMIMNDFCRECSTVTPSPHPLQEEETASDEAFSAKPQGSSKRRLEQSPTSSKKGKVEVSKRQVSSEDEEDVGEPTRRGSIGRTAVQPAQEQPQVQPVALPNEQESQNNQESEDSDSDDFPFVVEYSPTGRAVCRRCDNTILKGDIRVSHRPLFRGQRGFIVYRHLQCAPFDDSIQRARDVRGWQRLKAADLQKLKDRVAEAALEREDEEKELQPDELVQTSFSGEMRPTPPGLTANLLPFQVEGFSWMRHQEVNDAAGEEGACRGGMLADEMGMGKTVQTIATMCDNRPLLQHCPVGSKHAPDAHDFEARVREQSLWKQALEEWQHEMKMNEIPKKMLPRKKNIPGGRAGTLVVCPVIALLQWKSEIEKFTEESTFTVGVYHGPNRSSMTPEIMRKYDVVLTTYQCLEQDFRKMISPNKVTCPNCGGKFKIDKLRVHLKYFCGEGAQRTEAQARQRRASEQRAPSGPRVMRTSGGKNSKSTKSKKGDTKTVAKTDTKKRKKLVLNDSESDLSIDETTDLASSGERPSRRAAKKASSKVTASVKEWGSNERGKRRTEESDDDSSYGGGDDNDEESSRSGTESSDESEDEVPLASLTRTIKPTKATKKSVASGKTKGRDDPVERAKEKQRKALAKTKGKQKTKGGKKKGKAKGKIQSDTADSDDDGTETDEIDDPVQRATEKQRKALAKTKLAKKGKGKGKGGKPQKKKTKGKGKGKKPSDSDDDDSDNSGEDDDPLDGIDMNELAEEAMSGAQFSVLHSFCWWRVVLDEAHFIKTRSSQTAAAAFSLTAVHRWCCSGTPLQNRVGELYSLIRFLRIDPMAHYFCRMKGCDCKSVHYRMKEGICKDCGHRAFSHYSHFNRYILNVIQREGYSGDGRQAMFKLKNEVLDKCLLRRTKETRAEDMNLPPRIVSIRKLRLHPIEEDFYNSLYTQTRASFDDYVAEGTLLNNYAHIFDLLTKMRQAVDHPYLIVYSKNAKIKGLAPPGPAVANGSIDCDICHEPPMNRIVSSCCQSAFCQSCVEEYIGAAGGESTPCPSCARPFAIDLNQKPVCQDVTTPAVSIDSSTVPALKTLSHVQSGSILRRINLAEFATSSKIEVFVQDLIQMRQKRPGSKALVFSQFVNMLDLIRWRLHSDPCLNHMGLGVRILHGGMDIKSRDQAIREFREDSNVRVLLMSLKAGGVALNLTVASEVFLVDNWWNPAAEMQAIDRTHRLGQYRPIRATRYICEGTVEERVLHLQEKKRLVFDGTVGRDAGSLKALSVDDMKALFT